MYLRTLAAKGEQAGGEGVKVVREKLARIRKAIEYLGYLWGVYV